MLSPKRTKFRKYHRGKMRGKVYDCFFCSLDLNFSIFYKLWFAFFFIKSKIFMI